jgi:hypothetical protein
MDSHRVETDVGSDGKQMLRTMPPPRRGGVRHYTRLPRRPAAPQCGPKLACDPGDLLPRRGDRWPPIRRLPRSRLAHELPQLWADEARSATPKAGHREPLAPWPRWRRATTSIASLSAPDGVGKVLRPSGWPSLLLPGEHDAPCLDAKTSRRTRWCPARNIIGFEAAEESICEVCCCRNRPLTSADRPPTIAVLARVAESADARDSKSRVP